MLLLVYIECPTISSIDIAPGFRKKSVRLVATILRCAHFKVDYVV